jgi:L-fuculose-phosphate aldolase
MIIAYRLKKFVEGTIMVDFDFEQFKRDVLDSVSNAADAVSNVAKETSGDVARFKHFNETGRDLYMSGAVTSHGGNLSVSDGSSIWISRTGAMLGRLTPGDVLRVNWEPSPSDENASMELVVHRAMYRAYAECATRAGVPFGARAIVHAHTKYTVFRSLIADCVEPADSEGKLLLGAKVPVLAVEKTVASEEVAALMAKQVAAGVSVAIIRGHGPFAWADSLENALRLISCLEYSAEVLTLFEMTGVRGVSVGDADGYGTGGDVGTDAGACGVNVGDADGHGTDADGSASGHAGGTGTGGGANGRG